MSHDLIAICGFGLEKVVQRELADLQIDASLGADAASAGRVAFRGDLSEIVRTNLHLRCAQRVVIRVAEFTAADFDALFEQTLELPWGALIPADGQFPVSARSYKSQLTSAPALQRSIKKAIAQALQREHEVAELPETGGRYHIDLALQNDQALLTLDTSGAPLSQRGYQTQHSKAILNETLAAGLVKLSYWNPSFPLIDPCCGAGIIPIEAALIAARIAPGVDREFAFESWTEEARDLLGTLREQAIEQQLDEIPERILGFDTHPRRLADARQNAQLAGVDGMVHFQNARFDQISSKRRFGSLITRLPFNAGKPREASSKSREASSRSSERRRDETAVLYETIPDLLRRLPTWSHYVFTGNRKLEDVLGRPADRRRKLYDGKFSCTYYQFHGPKPVVEERSIYEGPAAVNRSVAAASQDVAPAPNLMKLVHAEGRAAFGELDEKAQHQADLFTSRLTKRAKHLRRWPTKRGITCYRLYERDIPEIPLVVDRYEDHLHITEFERPHDRDPAQHGNWLDLMAETAGKALSVPSKQIHFKRRGRQENFSQHEKVAQTGNRFEAHEGGLKFWVNLSDYIDTGLFLDHRITRDMVRKEAAGKDFLNLFAYTGSFTVYAADGGANSTTTVDLSNTYTRWAEDNLKLNGYLQDDDVGNHQLFTSDVVHFVKEQWGRAEYDLVVLDPPTYSRSKKTEQDWNVQRDALPLLQDVLQLVRPGGVVYFSNNFRRFKFDPQTLNVSACHEISKQTVPEDFRNRRIHRCWRIVR